ncbi:2-amino-3,7-dideoxy-D-threo-hept-6-ulosonate synthase [Prauserella shujinwangii]|uniref:2-amino-3,7-dideoxy-D-threo-hept-6-ulosonate synthase n=1 Tax=Prauserella shujinwangii TaxID=1453103 RepID=A0A2T0LTE7_9PSEU|nr:2-amino-3,7-dideoxy-D-threo-hept-6-ulosonate synthase [Prauserella shujinwangii]PRX46964.1 2-amino-3,7-dideoxy-D-threo-hept-6-ulosonate synthase [Prauserella shujinwangii]
MNNTFAKQLRLRRLYRHGGGRLLVVPLDHSVSNGPITGRRSLNELVGSIATNEVDAVVLHKGSLRYVDHQWFSHTSLIVHLSASTRHAPDPDAKYLVSSVEEALRLGADAVSVHVNLGSLDERRQIADMAAVADACDRWNMPLLAMIYPRGPKISDPGSPDLVSHATSLAVDLGADLVKAPYPGSVEALTAITSSCPLPMLATGGPRLPTTEALLDYVDDVLHGGGAGVAMGRNVFQAEHPGTTARLIAQRIHSGPVPFLDASSRASAAQPA